jgi:hypothetical protein
MQFMCQNGVSSFFFNVSWSVRASSRIPISIPTDANLQIVIDFYFLSICVQHS